MKKVTLLFFVLLISAFSWQAMAQVPGSNCSTPLVVTAIPFNDSGNTSTYGDFYGVSDVPPIAPGAIGNGSGSGYYLTGDEVVYSYTAGSNGFITIDLTNITYYVGLFVFTGCPFTSTVGYHDDSAATTRSVPNLPVIAGETYYIVISTWSAPQSTTYTIDITAGSSSCVAPSGLTVSNITDTSAYISWTENGTATEWEIEYGSIGFTQGTGSIITDNDGILGETLTNLTSNEVYDVYVRSICGAGDESTWVGPVTFATLISPCVDPSSIVVSNITDSGADVSWTENGIATVWEIEYGLTGFAQGSGTVVADNDGTLGETLSGLVSETTYDVYVRAICSATNMSAWVGPKSFTTDTTVNVNDNDFSGFAYYPNPMTDVINITSQNEKYELVIFNVVGQKLLTYKMEANTATLDVSHFASGPYLMQVVSESGKSAFYKLIKN